MSKIKSGLNCTGFRVQFSASQSDVIESTQQEARLRLSSANPSPQKSCSLVKSTVSNKPLSLKRAGLRLDHTKAHTNQKKHFEGRVML